jgi:hypothetical protein
MYLEFGPFGLVRDSIVVITFEQVGNALTCKPARPSKGYDGDNNEVAIVGDTCLISLQAPAGGWPADEGFILVKHSGTPATSRGIVVSGTVNL